ncbi:ABC transporter substrate-binding protein [Rhodospirillum rubrum]|uniref:Extracellular solute-binding protein, family 5 n=1 Tax=Rhodospirillum rubrum (strain ATCC 11170 / ATH 1.1.1 / DSM 467 / LMG 4362 / NCIMB 8255 / S1) TaxID=269796 RepID=Q2RSB7_RHORT|nr:ABC transporter substrate-binding protein [Rhodospirillum rubrum]ABC22978.1 extracellular solute-binding protein, family 5 [Rhodospirillum rubrum ATCC 11170]MBK5954603.1 peptide ABC transporter substrate-binding protein [Rhodospirillum rubrum]QXG78964.1 ABC transporter substrate-binding protein [Rhodospirillum rubrum]HAP98756.1 ABC transporter substrate-binding protein [Rhodospirillum rubrum]
MRSVKSTARTAFLALSCAALAGGLWAASGPAAQAEEGKRGGSLRLLARAGGGTLDPHINYTAQYFQTNFILYDGLVGFKKANGKDGNAIVADLAEALPTVSDDGKTYTFTLRKGVRFSNGQPVTTGDVVASFQRIFKVSSPTAGTFYNGILGADHCLAEPAGCTLAEGVSADPASGTIVIKLAAADAEFLQKLSLPHAAILPADAPAKDVGTDAIPGTGPYKIESYDPNTRLRLVRNPYFKEWSKDAQPDGYVDEINYDFGLTEEAAITAIQNGQADWMFDPPPPDRLPELGTKYAKQVHLNLLAAMWYAPMNVNLAPFNDERVRKAVNYAVDRGALTKLFGGANLATPACQILPPDFPSYEAYCPYTQAPGAKWSKPDLEKAKALVKDSGTAGQKVTVIVEDNAVARSIGVYLQGVLAQLGYDASVKPISQNIQFTYIQNTANAVQISVSQWYQDYPAASNFLNVLFSCGSFHPGSDSSINMSGFCDKTIDAQITEALVTATKDPAKAATQWTAIDKAITDKAPVAVLFTPKQVTFLSARVKGFVFNNQTKWLISQSWVE